MTTTKNKKKVSLSSSKKNQSTQQSKSTKKSNTKTKKTSKTLTRNTYKKNNTIKKAPAKKTNSSTKITPKLTKNTIKKSLSSKKKITKKTDTKKTASKKTSKTTTKKITSKKTSKTTAKKLGSKQAPSSKKTSKTSTKKITSKKSSSKKTSQSSSSKNRKSLRKPKNPFAYETQTVYEVNSDSKYTPKILLNDPDSREFIQKLNVKFKQGVLHFKVPNNKKLELRNLKYAPYRSPGRNFPFYPSLKLNSETSFFHIDENFYFQKRPAITVENASQFGLMQPIALKQDSFPNFWDPNIPWAIEETVKKEFFVGQRRLFERLWNILVDIPQGGLAHYCYSGIKKMGKTAFLTHFYNVAFSLQTQIVPLYYSFEAKKGPVNEIADDLAFTIAKQWAAFSIKEPALLKLGTWEHLLEVLPHLPHQTCIAIQRFMAGLDSFHSTFMIKDSQMLDLLKHFRLCARADKINFILILDEVQVMASGDILTDDGKEPMKDCFQALEMIGRNQMIELIISGSQPSIIAYQVLVDDVGNRIRRENFEPLTCDETNELVAKLVSAKNLVTYPQLGNDIFALTNGYPFYIWLILHSKYFSTLDPERNFSNQKGLRAIFNYEVSKNGEIFKFWDIHLKLNCQLLNHNPPEYPNLSYRILSYIADRPDQEIVLADMAKDLKVDVPLLFPRLENLTKADLVDWEFLTKRYYLFTFPDAVLRHVIRNSFTYDITGESSREEQKQNIQKLIEESLATSLRIL